MPAAFALARRVPRPTVSAASPGVAALAAIGASFLVGALAMLLLYPLWMSLGPRPPIPLFALRSLLSASAGGATALAAGGWGGLLVYAGYLVTLAVITLVRGWARATFDQSDLGTAMIASEPVALLVNEWPSAIGILIGIALRGLIRTKQRAAANALLEGAGTYVLVGTLLYLPLGFIVIAPGSGTAFAYVSSIVTAAAQALAAAFVLAHRSPRPGLSAGVLASVVLAAAAPLTIQQLETAFRYGALDAVPLLLFPLASAALVFAGTFGWRRALASRP